MNAMRQIPSWHEGPCERLAGGSCLRCNYPRAYAHPSSLLAAFWVDQLYVEGSAMQVYPDQAIKPGNVQIVQRDGRVDNYLIPRDGIPDYEEASTTVISKAVSALHTWQCCVELCCFPGSMFSITPEIPTQVAQIRFVLTPDVAEHVRIYDLRIICPEDGDAIGYSVLDHVPGYGPDLVREDRPIKIYGTFVSRYLPGSVFAGANGGLISLGHARPHLSHLCIIHQTAPGHSLSALVTSA